MAKRMLSANKKNTRRLVSKRTLKAEVRTLVVMELDQILRDVIPDSISAFTIADAKSDAVVDTLVRFLEKNDYLVQMPEE